MRRFVLAGMRSSRVRSCQRDLARCACPSELLDPCRHLRANLWTCSPRKVKMVHKKIAYFLTELFCCDLGHTSQEFVIEPLMKFQRRPMDAWGLYQV